MNWWTDGWKEGSTDGRMVGWMDGRISQLDIRGLMPRFSLEFNIPWMKCLST